MVAFKGLNRTRVLIVDINDIGATRIYGGTIKSVGGVQVGFLNRASELWGSSFLPFSVSPSGKCQWRR